MRITLAAKIWRAVLILLDLTGRESWHCAEAEMPLPAHPTASLHPPACRKCKQYAARGIAEIEQMLSAQN